MKNAFVIVTLSGLLSACAVAPPAQPVAESAQLSAEAREQAQAKAELDAKAEAGAEQARLPKVELTSTLLNQLLKAEFAFRGGDWQGPYLTMLSLAQQTRDPRLARRAAEMALAARQPEDTLAAVRQWRQLDPQSDEATQYYLGMVILSDNISDAEEIFRKRLEGAPAGVRGIVLYQVQQLLARAKDKEAAAAMLERLVAPYRGTLEGHVVLAQGALARGDKAGASREARAALALKPDSEIAVLTLAQAGENEGQVRELLATFVAANPNAREVRAAHARLLVNDKQFEAARSEFLLLDKQQPDNVTTLYALGVLSTQLNDPGGAETYFTRFIDVLGRNPEDERDPSKALLILSQLAEERGDIKAAVGWLDKLPEGDEKALFGTQLRRAQLLGKGGDVPAARRLLASLKPGEPAAQAQVAAAEAQVLRDAGQAEQAFILMQDAAKRFPTNPDLLYDFALLAEKTGHMEVMEQTLRDVMRLAPDNHHAYNALGYSLAERNVRLEEARALIEKALSMAPEDPFIMDSMGWVQYRLGNLDAAEAHLRRAYGLRRDPEIAVHLGEVLWQKGKQADAQKLWREARAKDPQNDTLRSTLARLRLSL
ncbi:MULTISPECIES: tetratricopeptide repeat protein [unclassified Massilia]|uniref:tetratricopeptide repeat protein n=1 Tax=unclassified Massilia TaxID=2609279 RepID=UPI00177DAF80|nr:MULTISPECIES: tetratricopeptide repeat protein [unclassified Massilia]MBD8529738.1 tetratricopeptide repeat protein [Massilia sp. CFBP 13647]MBD8673175.1 tetratricopeptide repeat protein [Massilia sp. CFBP 13721]